MKLMLLSSEPGLTCVETAEDITLLDFAEGGNPLEVLLGPDGFGQAVLVNLAKSGYMDSTGVGWLIQCHSKFQRAGGRLIIHSIAPMVQHCFHVLGLQEVLHIVADESAARQLAALRSTAAAH